MNSQKTNFFQGARNKPRFKVINLDQAEKKVFKLACSFFMS